jgi:hypothetical protein
MTKRDLTDIALKIVGLYMLTLSVDSLFGFIKSTTYFINPNAEALTYLVANSFRTCLFAFGFWLLTIKTSLVLNKLIKTDSETTTFTIDKTDMLQVLFCAAGIVITFFAISDFWNQYAMSTTRDYDDLPEKYKEAIYLAQIGIPATRVLLGIIFIFLSRKLAHLLTRKKI